ncbi:MAG: hypothetical protein KDE48_19105 [Anaerolineales bacterium]|nr:hypothetical protein [Anaerolineales bacterium]
MWGILGNGRILPLLWNAFLFHPHKPDNLKFNRKPTQREINWGEWFTIEPTTLCRHKLSL